MKIAFPLKSLVVGYLQYLVPEKWFCQYEHIGPNLRLIPVLCSPSCWHVTCQQTDVMWHVRKQIITADQSKKVNVSYGIYFEVSGKVERS